MAEAERRYRESLAIRNTAGEEGSRAATLHQLGNVLKQRGQLDEAKGMYHAALNIFFRWAIRQRRVTANPCSGVWHPGAPPARDRVLSDPEIRAFWLATDEVGQPFAPALKLLLLRFHRF